VDVTDLAEFAPGGEGFGAFVERTTTPLVRALVAAFGPDVGREAALDALAWGWEHWDRLERMSNPAGYLYRVGMTAGRRMLRRTRRTELRALVEPVGIQVDQPSDPELVAAIARLSARQRAAVVLVVGHGVPYREAGQLLGCSASSVRNHVHRALRRLRAELGDTRGD